MQVWFLPNECEPQTIGTILGKSTIRFRPGHLCWKMYDKSSQKVTSFEDMSTDSTNFKEVQSILPM